MKYLILSFVVCISVALLTSGCGKEKLNSVEDVWNPLQTEELILSQSSVSEFPTDQDGQLLFDRQPHYAMELNHPTAKMIYPEYVIVYNFSSTKEREKFETSEVTSIKFGEDVLYPNVFQKKNLLIIYLSYSSDNPLFIEQFNKAMDKLK